MTEIDSLTRIICHSILEATEKAFPTPYTYDFDWQQRMNHNYQKLLNHKPSFLERLIRSIFDTTIDVEKEATNEQSRK